MISLASRYWKNQYLSTFISKPRVIWHRGHDSRFLINIWINIWINICAVLDQHPVIFGSTSWINILIIQCCAKMLIQMLIQNVVQNNKCWSVVIGPTFWLIVQKQKTAWCETITDETEIRTVCDGYGWNRNPHGVQRLLYEFSLKFREVDVDHGVDPCWAKCWSS